MEPGGLVIRRDGFGCANGAAGELPALERQLRFPGPAQATAWAMFLCYLRNTSRCLGGEGSHVNYGSALSVTPAGAA